MNAVYGKHNRRTKWRWPFWAQASCIVLLAFPSCVMEAPVRWGIVLFLGCVPGWARDGRLLRHARRDGRDARREEGAVRERFSPPGALQVGGSRLVVASLAAGATFGEGAVTSLFDPFAVVIEYWRISFTATRRAPDTSVCGLPRSGVSSASLAQVMLEELVLEAQPVHE